MEDMGQIITMMLAILSMPFILFLSANNIKKKRVQKANSKFKSMTTCQNCGRSIVQTLAKCDKWTEVEEYWQKSIERGTESYITICRNCNKFIDSVSTPAYSVKAYDEKEVSLDDLYNFILSSSIGCIERGGRLLGWSLLIGYIIAFFSSYCSVSKHKHRNLNKSTLSDGLLSIIHKIGANPHLYTHNKS